MLIPAEPNETTPVANQRCEADLESLRAHHLSVAVVGRYPPPVGGVAVHVQRVASRMNASGHDVTVYCDPEITRPQVACVHDVRPHLSWKRWLIQYGLTHRQEIVHSHCGFAFSPALVVQLLRRKSVVVTLHTDNVDAGLRVCSRLERIAVRALLRSRRVAWIAVNRSIQESLIRAGADSRRVCQIPAYVRPDGGDHESSDLPCGSSAFMSAHSPRILAYACKERRSDGVADDYGLDLVIRAAAALKPSYPGLGLLLCVPDPQSSHYVRSLEELAESAGCRDQVHFMTSPSNGSEPLWRSTDIYVRPTRTDGDSLMVREALEHGVAVVASDCADRPAAVSGFRSGDAGDLADLLRSVVESDRTCALPADQHAPDGYDDLISVYRASLR